MPDLQSTPALHLPHRARRSEHARLLWWPRAHSPRVGGSREERSLPSHIVDGHHCWMLGHGVRRGVVTSRRRASTTQLELGFRQIDLCGKLSARSDRRGHPFDAVEEVTHDVAGLPRLDCCDAFSESSEERAQLETGEMGAEAKVRPSTAEPDMRIRVPVISKFSGSAKTDSSRFADS